MMINAWLHARNCQDDASVYFLSEKDLVVLTGQPSQFHQYLHGRLNGQEGEEREREKIEQNDGGRLVFNVSK